MLRALSGRRHRVMTGLAFFTQADERLLTGYDLTYVTFRELTDAMIDGYLDQETFLDKAGAYAVQEIGDAFVARMNGDYDNVVGFPVEKVRRLLARFIAPSLTVEVEDIDFPGSDGKAEAGGRKLLIPGAVTGERVLVQVVAGRGAAEVAEVIRVESASARRAVARCPHFGPCGGCLFQHVEYGTQLELKERYLRRTLEEAGLPDAAAATRPITASPDLYGFRNKMEFAFGEKFGAARPRPQGEDHLEPADLSPDPARRGMPDLRPGRRAPLPRRHRFRPRERPRGLRAGHAKGPSPPPRPPGGEAHGRAHGHPGDGRAARSSTSGRSPGSSPRPRRRSGASSMSRATAAPTSSSSSACASSPASRSSRRSWPACPSASIRRASSRPTRPGPSSSTAASARRPASRRRAGSWGSTAAAGRSSSRSPGRRGK